MTTQLLFESAYYSACVLKDGSLVVQSRRRRKGIRLLPELSGEWIEAIETALDAREANDICRAMLNSAIP